MEEGLDDLSSRMPGCGSGDFTQAQGHRRASERPSHGLRVTGETLSGRHCLQVPERNGPQHSSEQPRGFCLHLLLRHVWLLALLGPSLSPERLGRKCGEEEGALQGERRGGLHTGMK